MTYFININNPMMTSHLINIKYIAIAVVEKRNSIKKPAKKNVSQLNYIMRMPDTLC